MNRFNIQRVPENGFKLHQERHKDIDFKKLLTNEAGLIRHILTYMRTMRGVAMVPTWENLKETRVWWEMCRQLTDSERNKYRAWWNLLFDVQRTAEDKESCALALLYVVRERVLRSYSTWTGPSPEKAAGLFGVSQEHSERILARVKALYGELQPTNDATWKVPIGKSRIKRT